MRNKIKRVGVMLGTVGLALGAVGCSQDGYTDQSMQSLRYQKGATQGGAFEECVEPGQKIVTNDKLYPYPKTQREAVWDSDNFIDNNGNGIADEGSSADYPDLVVTDKDGNEVRVKMKLQFFLNTSCDTVEVDGKEYEGGTLQVFHEFFGKTRKAYFNEDGTYNSGWIWAMTNYLGAPAQKLAKLEIADESVEDLWKHPAKWDDISDAIIGDDKFAQTVNAGMQTDLQFYQNFSLNIFSIKPDDEFIKLFKERKELETRADTAELTKRARVTEAEADSAVLRKEMEPYGGPRNYLIAKCLEDPECGNPFQPSIPRGLVGGGSNN